MEEEGKLPLKRVELSLTKFNEVAIPHHLDLLRQHKANILKYEELGEYARVRTEQTHARRVASQLRSLLNELEGLRRQVRSADCAKFDQLTQTSRDLTLRAIMDYLETSPLSINRSSVGGGEGGGGPAEVSSSVRSTDSVGVIPDTVQLQVDQQEISIREREAVLAGWSSLQSEVRALHDAWQHVQVAALAHRERIEHTSENVEVAADNVQLARSHLASAESLRAGAYGLGGAVAGALLGGPVGAVLGAKAGAAALLAGSTLGYLAAAALGRRRRSQIHTESRTDADTAVKKEQ